MRTLIALAALAAGLSSAAPAAATVDDPRWSAPIVVAAPAPAVPVRPPGHWGGTTTGVFMTAGARAVLRAGGCDWLYPYLAERGLPIDTFMAISARESGCAVNGVRVNNSTDLSTSRFGLNFKGSMPEVWGNLCGITDWTAPGREVRVDVYCTAQAFKALGLKPWRVG